MIHVLCGGTKKAADSYVGREKNFTKHLCFTWALKDECNLTGRQSLPSGMITGDKRSGIKKAYYITRSQVISFDQNLWKGRKRTKEINLRSLT